MFVRDLLVSCNATDVGTMMFANSHKPLDRHRARLRPSLSAQRRLLGTRGLSRQPAWVGRTTSRVSCRWHWNPSWVCNPSRRCKKTRRERSLGHRSSVSVAAARILLELGGGRLRMAGKALESFFATSYPLSTYPWDRGAKSSTTSEQVASSLSGYPSGVQHDRRLQRCRAVRRKRTHSKYGSIPTIVLHT